MPVKEVWLSLEEEEEEVLTMAIILNFDLRRTKKYFESTGNFFDANNIEQVLLIQVLVIDSLWQSPKRSATCSLCEVIWIRLRQYALSKTEMHTYLLLLAEFYFFQQPISKKGCSPRFLFFFFNFILVLLHLPQQSHWHLKMYNIPIINFHTLSY